jgi:hypothetical protein
LGMGNLLLVKCGQERCERRIVARMPQGTSGPVNG